MLWAPIATFAHWVNTDQGEVLLTTDDGDGLRELITLWGCAILTALEAVEQARKLKPKSEIMDLGLVIALLLHWSHGLEDYGIEDEAVEWRGRAVAYALKAGLSLQEYDMDLQAAIDDNKDTELTGNQEGER